MNHLVRHFALVGKAMFLTIAIISILFVTFSYLLLKPYRYWSKNGVKQCSITELFLDNLKLVFRLVSVQEFTVKLYERFADERYVGIYSFFSPLLYVKDTDLIKQITIRDFEHFVNHIQFLSLDEDPVWARSLVFLPGDAWKAMRATISPSFTISKMKGMFGLVKECADIFVSYYEENAIKMSKVDANEAFMKYANDVIASTVFGVTCNSHRDPNNEFFLMGKRMVDGFWNSVSFILPYFSPKLAKLLGMHVLNREATEFFRKLVKQNINEREKNDIIRMDMIHLLVEAKKGQLRHDESHELDAGFASVQESTIGRKRYKDLHLSDDDMTAQALVFFFAGFDSSSRSMAFLAYELALNPEVQQRLQDEIDTTLQECNGSITFDALLKMKYLDMVISETLRKWPSIASIDRVCTKPYTIQPQRAVSMGVVVYIALVALAYFLYRQYCIFQFWRKLSIPYETPVPIFGNLLPTILHKKALGQIHKEMYDKYSNHRYLGFYIFSCPSLMIRDPELVKQICIKDFNHFSDHRQFLPPKADPFWNKMLFARKGRDWHDYRVIMSPAYSQTKTKVKYPFMTKSAQRLVDSLPVGKETATVDAFELFLKFSNDVTLNHAYGIEHNSFEETESELYRMAKLSFASARVAGFKFFGAAISSSFANIFKITFFQEETKQFYRKLMKDTLAYREKHNIVQLDVLHLLTEAQKGRFHVENDETNVTGLKGVGKGSDTYIPPKITDDDILIQLLGLFLANFESFATYISNLAYELAINQDVQEKLIKEIDNTWRKCGGNLTYDHLINMKYIDMVCNEGLRHRSPTLAIDRAVTIPYTIEPILPHEKPLHLKVGQDITIPVYCISHDEKYFENPDKFDPERFSDENKDKILPETLLGLGYGSRFCIGARIVPFQTKLVLFYLLLKFRLEPTDKTVIPYELHKSNVSHSSEHGYWLGIKPRDDAPQL